MNNLFYAFEAKFEAILDMKKTNEMEENSFKTYINYAISFTIILLVFFSVGILLNTIENFNYVAYGINAAIFGSFLFVKLYNEERYQQQFNVKYNKYIAVTLDSLKLLVIQFTVTSILYFFVYGAVTNNFSLIVNVLLSTIFFAAYALLSPLKSDKKPNFSILIHIILIHQFYMIAFRIYIFSNVALTTLFWTIILLTLLLIRDIIRNIYIPIVSGVGFKIIVYFLVLVSFQNLLPRLDYEIDMRDDFYIHNYAITIENPNKILELPMVNDYFDGDYFIYEDHLQIFVQEENWNRRVEVIYNEYLNIDSFLFDDVYWFVETISEQDGEFHHVIFKIENYELKEVTHTTHTTKPDYTFKDSEKNTGRIKPPEIFIVNLTDNYIYVETEVGVFIYDKEYNLLALINHESSIWNSDVHINNNEAYMHYTDRYEDEFDNVTYTYYLYRINSSFELELIYEINDFPTKREFGFIKNDEYYYYDSLLWKYDVLMGGMIIAPLDYNEKVVYQDSRKVYIQREGMYEEGLGNSKETMLFSNGYILIQNKNSYKVKVASIDDYITKNTDNYITLDNPNNNHDEPSSTELFYAFRVTEDRFILYDFYNVHSFDKDGDLVESMNFLSMSQASSTYLNNDILTTIDTSYGNELIGRNYSYNIIELDPDKMSETSFRNSYTSWMTCENPYGCDDFSPMSFGIYIYVQLFVNCWIMILPSKKKPLYIEEFEWE